MSGFQDQLTAAALRGAASAIGPVTIRSTLNPDSPLVLEVPTPGEPAGSPDSQTSFGILTKLLKPEVRLQALGAEMTFAPGGVPQANYTPILFAGLGLGVFTLLGLGSLFGRFASKRTLLISGAVGLAAIAWVASQSTFDARDTP